ncbi:jg14331 [Pararge aegeria aegeria]|uniref:Jg14331 protein n=1 Tax=Pararge aegeria aegeria TaxID=348720 RepID=A0A8S4R8K5_9NEOP|nr:jg14331 [Pararge aegeria aegeria]
MGRACATHGRHESAKEVDRRALWRGVEAEDDLGVGEVMDVTRACWRASEWGSARMSLNPRAPRSEGIVGLRAPHVRPNLGSGDDWSERVTDGD